MTAEAVQWTKRQISEKCLEISRHTLLEMGHKLGHGKMVDARMEILLAATVRTVNSSRAIQLLYTDRPYSEEMHTLLRSLAEMVINAAYLQVAPEEELESYRQNDSIMLSKAMRLANDLIPGCIESIPKTTREAFEVHADEIRQSTSGTASKTSWTKKDLHSRASAVDKVLGTTILQFLSRIVFPQGHSYTHGSFSSLSATIDSFRTGGYAEVTIREGADLALFGTAQALHVFAMAISLLKDEEDYSAHLSVVQDLLRQYNDAPSIISSVAN
jgi:Family of unknown function (DUF5677)